MAVMTSGGNQGNGGLAAPGAGSGGMAGALGMASDYSATTAPGSLYHWNGPDVQDLDKAGQDAQKQKAAQLPLDEYGNIKAGSEYLQGNGFADQQLRQRSLEDALTATANGTGGPSAAELQMKQGQEQNLNNLLAASRSARGPGMGTAGYNAAQAGAAAGASVSQQTGILRAQEAAQARNELAGVLGTQENANLAAAAQQQQLTMYQAGLNQQQNQLGAQTGLGYAGLGVNVGANIGQLGVAQGQNMLGVEGINAGVAGAAAGANTALVGAGASAAGAMMTGGATMAAQGAAKGGGGSNNGGIGSDINAKQDIQPAGNNGGRFADAYDPNTNSQYNRSQRLATPSPVTQPIATVPLGPNAAPVTAPASSMSRSAATERPLPPQATPPAAQIPIPQQQNITSDEKTKTDLAPAGANRASLADHVDAGLADRLIHHVANKVVDALGGPASESKKLDYDIKLAKARNEVDKVAIPLAARAKEDVPGMQTLSDALSAPDRARQTRDPVSFQREYSTKEEADAERARRITSDENTKTNIKTHMEPVHGGETDNPIPDKGVTGPVGPAANHDHVTRWAASNTTSPTRAYYKPEKPESADERTQRYLAKSQINSDKRIKDVKLPGGRTDGDDFLDALTRSMATYTYKDPTNEPTDKPTGDRYLGVMAQALEDTPTGNTLVKEGPKGKYLEMGPNLSAALAGLGRVNERLMQVEYALGERNSPKVPKRGGKK